jgi:hypothetical protein
MGALGLVQLGVPASRAFAAGPGPYFDIHTHLGMEWGNRPVLGVDDLLRWMDKHDVASAAVLPLISPESWDHPLTTDYVLRETAPHRDRLSPFCSIDPRTINLGSYELKLDLLKRYRDAGARGFGEHKAGVAMDDPRNIEVFAAAAEAGLPVLFHLDNQRNWDAPGLPGLARVLEQVPQGVFIGHAQGWWASISGDVTQDEMQGYPKSKVAPGGAIDALMDKFPNLYGDVSAGSGANAIQRDLRFGRDFLIRRADRLLFGTDYLAPGQDVPQFDLYQELRLPREAADKIFRGNGRALLGIAG